MRHGRLWVVIVVTVVVRVAVLLLFPEIFAYERTGQIHGSEAYDVYAQNLLETGVYGREPGVPDATLPPLYSYLLAGVYALIGRGGWQVGLFHTVLDALSVAALYAIACRLFADVRVFGQPVGGWVGLLAGLFTACYPYLVFQNLTLIDTPLFILLLHGFVLLLIHLRERAAYDRGTLLLALAAGVVLGVSLLVRALLPPLALLAALWFLFRLSLRQTVLRLAPVALVGVLVLVPWIARGYALYDAFVPVALNSGENLYQGNNPQTVPLFRAGYDAQWSAPPPGGEDITDRYARNAFLAQAALDYLRAHPERIPELLWTKFLVHWSVDITPRRNPQPGQRFTLDEQGKLVVESADDSMAGVTEANTAYDRGVFDTVGRPLHRVYFGGLLGLALVGVGLTLRLWRRVALLWFVQITMTGMYLLFHPSTRYRVPSDPLLFVFSAYALVWFGAWLYARRSRGDLRKRPDR